MILSLTFQIFDKDCYSNMEEPVDSCTAADSLHEFCVSFTNNGADPETTAN